jgi:hypothetical protein
MSESPSPASSLHTFVDARFREAFGQPHNTMGGDDHWRLLGSPSQMAINIVVNGTRDVPAVWVFDGHADGKGVFSASITNQDQVADLIVRIQDRVNYAPGAGATPPKIAGT